MVPAYLASCSTCSSSCAILASSEAMVDLNLDLTAPSISCSLLRSSLFCRSSCCRALSFFWAALRSVASSLLSCSAWGAVGGKAQEGGRMSRSTPCPPGRSDSPAFPLSSGPVWSTSPQGSPAGVKADAKPGFSTCHRALMSQGHQGPRPGAGPRGRPDRLVLSVTGTAGGRWQDPLEAGPSLGPCSQLGSPWAATAACDVALNLGQTGPAASRDPRQGALWWGASAWGVLAPPQHPWALLWSEHGGLTVSSLA